MEISEREYGLLYKLYLEVSLKCQKANSTTRLLAGLARFYEGEAKARLEATTEKGGETHEATGHPG